MAIPLSSACRGPRSLSVRPSRHSSPASAGMIPAMIFMRVDLPAPFSPISACTVPRSTRSETSSSAATPGKLLLMFRASSRQRSGGAATSPCILPSVPAEVTREVRRGYELEGDPHEARDLLTAGELERGVDGVRALRRPVLEHGRLELTRFEDRQPIGSRVDPRDHGGGQQSRLLERLDGADRHL